MSHIYTYQDYSQIFKVMLSLCTGRSFATLACKKKKKKTLKNKIRNFERSFCILLFSLCFYHLFTVNKQNLTCPQPG